MTQLVAVKKENLLSSYHDRFWESKDKWVEIPVEKTASENIALEL